LATTAQCKPQAHLGRATGEKRSPTVLRGGLRKADATAAERTRRQGGCVRTGVVRVERCRAQQESCGCRVSRWRARATSSCPPSQGRLSRRRETRDAGGAPRDGV